MNKIILIMLKKHIIILSLILLSFSKIGISQDTLEISDIVINSQLKSNFSTNSAHFVNIISSDNLKKSTSSNINDLLDATLGIDLQQRGTDNTQADLSIRGGNFDQNLILINGIPFSDLQTGHNSLSLSMALGALQRVEILQGPGTRLYGIGAYSGAINFVTKNSDANKITINSEYGQFGYFNANAFVHKKIKHTFVDFAASVRKSDGYFTNTDFINANGFISVYKQNKKSYHFFQALYDFKNFGAYNFYTPNFPFQHEDVSKSLLSYEIGFGHKNQSKITIYFNHNNDIFELFREDENWYIRSGDFWIRNDNDTAKYANVYKNWAYYKGHNYHIAINSGISFMSDFNSIIGKTNYGILAQNNSIISTVLGTNNDTITIKNINYTKSDTRNTFTLFVDQHKTINNFTLSLGGNIIYNSSFGIFNTFGSDIKYNFRKNMFLYTSVNQGVRLPTFTDLYYNGPSNVGNENLKPEKATTFELGYKYLPKDFILQSSIFYRLGKNTIDWVKFDENEKWKTLNYTELNTFGIDFQVKKTFKNKIIESITLNYSYLLQNLPKKDVVSKYSLNYLKHNFSSSFSHHITSGLYFNWRIKYNYRNGSYFYFDDKNTQLETKFSPFWLFDARLSYNIKFITFYVQAVNIFNTQYYDLSYIKLPGRQIFGGISLTFSNK